MIRQKEIIRDKVFVTGATGMLGTHLLLDLLKKGYKVKALKRKGSNLETVAKIFQHYTDNFNELLFNIEWVDGDLYEPNNISELLTDVKWVFHLAAKVSFAKKDADEIKRVNIEGTANLVNVCLAQGIEKFCMASSIAALGHAPEGVDLDETTERDNNRQSSVYSLSKYRSELEVWRGIAEGLNAVIVNPSVILGPWEWGKSSSSFFSTIDKGLPYYTLGGTGFVDVRDVAKAMLQLIESNISGERFILNSANLTYKEAFEAIAKSIETTAPAKLASPLLTEIAWRFEAFKQFLGGKPKITKENAQSSQKRSSYSNQKIKDALDFEFIPIEQTIEEVGDKFLFDKKVGTYS